MKISLFLLTLGLLQVYAGSYGQDTKLTIKESNIVLENLLSEIESQSEFFFFYSNEKIDKSMKVSVNAQNKTIASILDQALKGSGICYQVIDKAIILSKEKMITIPAARQTPVTGTVTDGTGDPMPGVNVVLRGTTTGVITDINGKYSINVSDDQSVLVFSFVGYATREITVGNQRSINISLTEDTQEIDEIVVVGYGTQKKANLTGAVGAIKAEEALKSRPATNVQELLAGSVPGLNVTKGSGSVGSGADINIRGTSTVGKSSGVLIIIDGFPGSINTINPNDIESISILKDAASAAIYGSRAANGVMLITTKKGKETDRAVVEFSSSVGIQNPQFMLDFVGSEDYMRMYDQALVNDGKAPVFGTQGIADLKAGKYADVKWYKEIYQKNTLINNNYLAFSGQQKSISYRFSGSYDYQDGNLPNNKYNRYILKPDMTIRIFENLSFRGSMQYTQTEIDQPYSGDDNNNPQNEGDGTTYWQSQASRIAPINFVREDNGLYGVGSSMAGNPIAGVHEGGSRTRRNKELLTILDLRFEPLKDWNIIGSFANYTYDHLYKNRSLSYFLYNAAGDVAKTETTKPIQRQLSENNRRTTIQLTTDYSFDLTPDHHFKALLGFSQEYYITEKFWASRDNMPFPDINVLNGGTENEKNGGNAYDVAIRSFFGRINYDYMGKYLFEANLRADGSSRFAEGNRWGVFPSFSAGWNIARERFVMDKANWLSELKLRASWGILGDSEKEDLGYYPTYNTLTYNANMYAFNNKMVTGAYAKRSINPDITWEEATITNIGLDFGILNQKIKASFDYFINDRVNILSRPPVSMEFGLEAPFTNSLAMRSQGVELQAEYRDSKGDFHWGIAGNVSRSKSKVTDMAGTGPWIETVDGTTRYTEEGGQYRLAYGYIDEGLFQTPEEITGSAKQFSALLPGNIRYKNLNTEGSSANAIDGADRAVITEKVPWMYGLNISFGYKQFDFSANGYGKWGNYRYLNGYEGWAFYLTQNARPMHLDAWTESNPGASYPRLTASNTSNDYIFSSYWYRKASYFKLQNIQLGYTFPQELLKKIRIDYLRLYVSGQNIATFTKYDGFDPEGGYYPLSRTWAFGLNLKF